MGIERLLTTNFNKVLPKYYEHSVHFRFSLYVQQLQYAILSTKEEDSGVAAEAGVAGAGVAEVAE